MGGSCIRPSERQDYDPKVRAPGWHSLFSSFEETPPTPLLPLNNSRTSLSRKELQQRESAYHLSRPAWYAPHSQRYVRTVGLVRPLSLSSFSLLIVEHALKDINAGATIDCLGLGRRADVTYPQERTKPDAARAAVELLQETDELRRPRRKSKSLNRELWCWEVGGDMTENGW
ncbi:hypothetical protein EI94DRAFT_1809789 [Lactarius quietus]|nr:hypothetical protein EI94DRAFT_1809789 [Lactarius quietus]